MCIDQKKENISKFFCTTLWYYRYLSIIYLLFLPSIIFSNIEANKQEEKKGSDLFTAYNLQNLMKDSSPRWIVYLLDESSSSKSRLQKGVLFTHAKRTALSVFLHYNNIRVPMLKGQNGIWYYIFSPFNQKNRLDLNYFYIVDNYHIHDIPNEKFIQDPLGAYISTWSIDTGYRLDYKTEIVRGEEEAVSRVSFKFISESARDVYVIGDFNNWMMLDSFKSREKGVFVLDKILPKGEYGYLFVIDGNQYLDISNEKIRYHSLYDKVSYLDLR